MTTKIHADGIKTVVHTSKSKAERQIDFLRRAGFDVAAAAYTSKSVFAAEAEHNRLHDATVCGVTMTAPQSA